MDFYTTVGLASSAITLADKAKGIKNTLDKIYRLITEGKRRVIVFGAGGTGKSTLSYKLIGKERGFDYMESPNIEKIAIKGNVFGSYMIAPGQGLRAERYGPDLYRRVVRGEVDGIINVVTYGFHSEDIGEISYKNSDYYTGGDERTFIENFLSAKRDDEIKQLRKIADEIAKAPNKIWMVTLVNKQDLWWENKIAVKEHYTTGPYSSIIKDIYAQKGVQSFLHEYISASLFNLNFRIGSDFVKATASGYDDSIRTSNYSNFVTLLKSLIDAG